MKNFNGIKTQKQITKLLTLTACVLSFNAFAGGPDHMAMLAPPSIIKAPWSAIISGGYTNYSNMYSNDGQTAVARLAIDRSICAHNHWLFGIEVGVQTGNTMRLEQNQAVIDLFDGFPVPVQTTEKPMLDLLATMTKSFDTTAFFLQGKAGIAYRRWQFNNINSVNDLSQVDFEAQAGVGYQINSSTSLSILYQGIFGGNPHLTVNTVAGTGTVSNIPMQNGALLSLSTAV